MAVERAPHRFTVDEYHQMIAAGIFTEDDRLELIDGEIIEMATLGGPHITCVNRLTMFLATQLADRAIVSVQNAVTLGDFGEPEPDVVVLVDRDYAGEVPRAEDVILLIEVSDSSIGFDRGRKLPMYAAAGIPEAWLVDIQSHTIERHTDPRAGAYRLTRRATHGDEIESEAVPGLVLRTDDVLGPPRDVTDE
jgi:Uma2 family endonuclease